MAVMQCGWRMTQDSDDPFGLRIQKLKGRIKLKIVCTNSLRKFFLVAFCLLIITKLLLTKN